MSSYRWVADNYEDGDRIFLFGENILDMYFVVPFEPNLFNRFFSWRLSSPRSRRND